MLLEREPQLLDEARRTTRRVAKTFTIAVRLLPRAVRDDVHLLYLVFRTLDDLVDDGHPEAQERIAAVEAWCAGRDGVAEQDGVPGGRPASGALTRSTLEVRILTELARRHAIPRRAMADFCAGMRSDLAFVQPRTEAELDAYCYRVAGTVGVVMSAVLGLRGDRDAAHRAAAALGVAMQRTNILRDIDEDRAAGRTYLSVETIRRFGPADPGRREALLRDQIARADARYAEGRAGIAQLASGRSAVRSAGAMYQEILRQLERESYGAREGRAVVSRRRKLTVATRAAAPT